MVEAATEKAFAKRQKTTTSYVGIGRQVIESDDYNFSCSSEITTITYLLEQVGQKSLIDLALEEARTRDKEMDDKGSSAGNWSDIPGSSDKPDYSFRTADTAALSWSLVAFVMELKDELAEVYTECLGETTARLNAIKRAQSSRKFAYAESDEEEDKPEDQTGTQEQDSEAGKEENDSPRVERIGLPGDTQGTGPKAWYGKKRIRKEHLETFEKVFQRTKRPTGALIQNIVELTHVPRKRVLDWFENRRQEHAARRKDWELLISAELRRYPCLSMIRSKVGQSLTDVAVKICPGMDDELFVLGMLTEKKVAGVLPILYSGKLQNGDCYLVTRYCQQITLDMQAEAILSLARGVAMTLGRFSREGVVHGDVSIGNIVFGTDRHGGIHPYLVDFGSAVTGGLPVSFLRGGVSRATRQDGRAVSPTEAADRKTRCFSLESEFQEEVIDKCKRAGPVVAIRRLRDLFWKCGYNENVKVDQFMQCLI
ncbi:hypothetical protein SELMODRAFT_402076 [Selaginella moellendorffii]|uniref:Homeobox domain-containing protein n=1 Tax=Selaginella moellendorffii TaxID=88036 RepID=D8QPI1_SELML|nr:hypothetical protein SELMODRAFT_402076 [Selaginella moellendorffii]